MRKQTRGIGTYIIILAIIVLVMFLSDNLYKMNRNNYNFESFSSDLNNKAISAVDIYQNQAAPTGEIEVTLGVNENKKTESFYTSDVNEVVSLLREKSFTNQAELGGYNDALPAYAGYVLCHDDDNDSRSGSYGRRCRQFQDDEFWKEQSQNVI